MNISTGILVGILVLLVILLAAIPFIVSRTRSVQQRKTSARHKRVEAQPAKNSEQQPVRSTGGPVARDTETGANRLEEPEDISVQAAEPARKNGRPH